jgi:hypothetical protein
MPKAKNKSQNKGKQLHKTGIIPNSDATEGSGNESTEYSDSLDTSHVSATCQSEEEMNSISESEEEGVLSEGVQMLSLPSLTPLQKEKDIAMQTSARKRIRDDKTPPTEIQNKIRRTEINNNDKDFYLRKKNTEKNNYPKIVQQFSETTQHRQEMRTIPEEVQHSLMPNQASCSTWVTETGQSQEQGEVTQEISVIIIEPKGSPEEVERFLGSDVRTARAMNNTDFKLAGIIDVKKNNRRKHLLVKIKGKDNKLIQQLLEIKEIGNQPVQCRLPKEYTYSCGVIGPIGMYTTAEEIVEDMEINGYINPEAIRLTKGKEKVPSAHFKITFKLDNVPEHVYIGYQRYEVRPYVNRPFQCYQCQAFGHSAADCRREQKCLICAGPHNYKDCNTENGTKKCSNCGENHTSTFSGCRAMKMAVLVEKTKTEKKITYSEAVATIKKNSISRPTNSNVSRNYSEPTVTATNSYKETYLERALPIMNQAKPQKAIMKEIGTQTHSQEEDIEFFNTTKENRDDNNNNIPKWAAFMIQIITIKEISSHKEKCIALMKSLDKILGIRVNQLEVEEFLTPPMNAPTVKGKSKRNQLTKSDA